MDRATPIKNSVHQLGQQLGFRTAEEIDQTFLSTYLDESYTPRVDVIWYLDLQELGLNTEALAEYLGYEDDTQFRRFPFVGFEIEASYPTTKTMQADLANLRAIGAPFGVLVVDVEREENLYRRANRMLRTFRKQYGLSNFICLDKSQIDALNERDWDTGTTVDRGIDHRFTEGTGGESDWAGQARANLIEHAEEIGFVIKEDWVVEDLRREYDRKKSLWDDNEDETDFERYSWGPNGQRKPFSGWNTYYTRSEIDHTWVTPYPESLQQLMDAILEMERDFETHTPLIRDADSFHPFFAFEIETTGSKHAAGGLLNLGAYSTIGQVIVPSEQEYEKISRKIETYQQALGVRNIEAVVNSHD